MSDFSATDAAFTGIRFVREHPRTVAIWAGLQIVVTLVVGVVAALTIGPYLVQLQALNHPGQTPDMGQVFALLGRLMPMWALFAVLSLLFHAILYATMARAVLEPAEEGFGYIRFGMDEARQLLLVLLIVAIVIGFEVLAGICVIVPSLVVGAASGAARPLVTALCVLAAICAAIYFMVRLSLASPLTFATRRVDLFGSWTLTRGRFWKMLGTYLLVIGVALIILLLTLIITVAVAAVLGGLGAAASIFQASTASIGAFLLPARLAVTVIWAIATPLFWALCFMPASEIYKQLERS